MRFVYVLEGSVVMQLKGGKEITLTPGQTFYEGPNDIHTVGRNASSTKPAKFIVFLVKDKGAPVLVPVNPTAAGVSASPKLNSGAKVRGTISGRRPVAPRSRCERHGTMLKSRKTGQVVREVPHCLPTDGRVRIEEPFEMGGPGA